MAIRESDELARTGFVACVEKYQGQERVKCETITTPTDLTGIFDGGGQAASNQGTNASLPRSQHEEANVTGARRHRAGTGGRGRRVLAADADAHGGNSMHHDMDQRRYQRRWYQWYQCWYALGDGRPGRVQGPEGSTEGGVGVAVASIGATGGVHVGAIGRWPSFTNFTACGTNVGTSVAVGNNVGIVGAVLPLVAVLLAIGFRSGGGTIWKSRVPKAKPPSRSVIESVTLV